MWLRITSTDDTRIARRVIVVSNNISCYCHRSFSHGSTLNSFSHVPLLPSRILQAPPPRHGLDKYQGLRRRRRRRFRVPVSRGYTKFATEIWSLRGYGGRWWTMTKEEEDNGDVMSIVLAMFLSSPPQQLLLLLLSLFFFPEMACWLVVFVCERQQQQQQGVFGSTKL